MRKVAAIGAIAATFLAVGSAQAHGRPHWRLIAAPKVSTPKVSVPQALTSSCPFDGPDHMFTIVNAGVTNVTLPQIAAIQRGTRDESFALRLYYGTPCARFGSGGTPIYLSDGYEAFAGGGSTYQLGGYHTPSATFPSASQAIYVQTGLTPYTTWVRAFTHEVIEDLVNPGGFRMFGTYLAEVCDPVENLTYEVDQLQVSDFVTPNYWIRGSRPLDAGHYL